MKKFTLIELLLIISIISILVSMLLPALKNAKNVALKTDCMSNMRQLGFAEESYCCDYNNYMLPSHASVAHLTWPCKIYNLGYLKRDSNAFKCAVNKNPIFNITSYTRSIYCISGVDNNYLIPHSKSFFKAPSHAMLRGEGVNTGYTWATDINPWIEERRLSLELRHSGTMNVLYADGHSDNIRSIPSPADAPFWKGIP